ncbi:hypothetical protein [Clostridium ihumii]|uniref:hypothetical protein n=1 Tax=Clostridium ihumii TaxID=1470356 RepID=UPI003D32C3A6
MTRREEFTRWMLKHSNRSKNTIDKYAAAVVTISKELTKYSNTTIDIYSINDSMSIDSIKQIYLKIDVLREKDERGNRMYTSALEWYKKYLKEAEFISNIAKEQPSEYSVKHIKKLKGEFKIKDGMKYWNRDRSIVDKIIYIKNNECEYDNTHRYFISKATNKNYVEGHHLIQMQFQDMFEYSLDVESNIVSVCLVCHKILHLGRLEDKIKIIEKLYNLREHELKSSGLDIRLDELIELYK